ncbi:MAG TPA: magnesium/cobalt transporter CorA [Acidimicrobiales bacterium]|nr:magnesium/cobalt transporter CorA [Acidimicrobiales bacterium]
MIVDCAVYSHDGRRPGVLELVDALEASRDAKDAFVWIGLKDPTESELAAVAEEFELHPLAVEDAVNAHQRPKVETYGDTLFVVLKSARYVDHEELVEICEIMLFLGPTFVVSVRHGESPVFADVRRMLDTSPERLEWGPAGVLHASIDHVVDDYEVVLQGLEHDVEEIERQVFSDDRDNHAERIYRLKREVLEFRQAVIPLRDPLEALISPGDLRLDDPVKAYFRDIHDHLLRVGERVETVDALLTSALSANLAQVGVRQNEDMRKISAWVAILAVPTAIAGIYGMNFDHMPELRWLWGYPFALSVMAVACLTLFRLFRSRGWL